MPELSPSNLLVLLMTAMLVWVSVNVLISTIRINRTYELVPNRFIYPANCKPELCQDPAGFIRFMTPRLIGFGVLGLLLSVFFVVNEMTGLLAALPAWFSEGAALFLFVPLFVWYVIFINKAAKRFW
ncbi:MAG: hypothetical protein J5789_02875 [Oscillospiraceae bacterium]|nr:hypothetical protein [Oscillospiraceae bacterium]